MKSPLLLTTAVAVLLVACATGKVSRIEPTGERAVTTAGGIDIKDWLTASEAMIQSLLSSGRIVTPPDSAAVMAISRIANNTTQQVDTDLLVKNIRIALNKSGKIVTTTTVGLGGTAEDPLAKELAAKRAAAGGPNRVPDPSYTLSGKILENRQQQGNAKTTSYVFQLSLTDVNGIAVWEDQKIISKYSKRTFLGL
ncbi:MAG: penicillin-binding protein activator LpoB [Verrucomicrobia bacterium]|nr:penicillin-binding protein activator LpoB [Verrucomicrobiota bacterium]